MSTATAPKKSMTNDERTWLQKLGTALNAPLKSIGGGAAGKAGSKAGNLSGGDAQTPPAADPNAANYQKEILKVGSKGPAVESLQKKLNESGASLTVDGKFGPATQQAVKKFQQANSLSADGIVGPKTWAALASGGVAPTSGGPGASAAAFAAGGPGDGKGEAKQATAKAKGEPTPTKQTNRPTDSEGRRLLTTGVWNGSTTLRVRGGQGMHFALKNLNVLGTTISISSNLGGQKQLILLPAGSGDMVFTCFGSEPMSWTFDIGTHSDAFLVRWELYSTWVEGDPPNG